MLRISLLWIGKTKHEWLKTGIEHYVKRLKRYFSIKIIELKEPKVKYKQKHHELLKKEQECQIIKNILRKNPAQYKIILDERGKEFNSISFSNFLTQLEQRGIRDIVFIIGGAYGFADEILNLADLKLSLSRFTFTHDMSRLILVEQLYRAANIKANTPYHH